jgi:hypothetical protein
MRNNAWFIGSAVEVLLLHVSKRNDRYRNKEVEQINDNRPNVETAIKPCERTPGRGDRVLLASSSVIMTVAA